MFSHEPGQIHERILSTLSDGKRWKAKLVTDFGKAEVGEAAPDRRSGLADIAPFLAPLKSHEKLLQRTPGFLLEQGFGFQASARDGKPRRA